MDAGVRHGEAIDLSPPHSRRSSGPEAFRRPRSRPKQAGRPAPHPPLAAMELMRGDHPSKPPKRTDGPVRIARNLGQELDRPGREPAGGLEGAALDIRD